MLPDPRGGVGDAGQAVPEEDELAESNDRELTWIVGDPLFRQQPLSGAVSSFSHLLVLTVKDRVLAGVIHSHPDAFGEGIIAAAKLDGDVVAYEDRLVEDQVVTDKPRQHRHPEKNRPSDGGKEEALATFVELPGKPASGKRQERKHGRIAEANHTPK